MLNLRRKATLNQVESLWLCSTMQTLLLDEVFSTTGWDARDAVFHGGTSIKFAWGSPRFSEDLDFMVARPSLEGLGAAIPKAAENIERRVRKVLPGSVLTFRLSPERPGRDRMDTWDIRWSHEMRQGVARVKGEFYAVDADLLARYPSTIVRPSGIEVGIPTATLASLWGDKVKAIGSRAEFKMRDAHDLGFISRLFDEIGRPADAELRDAVVLSSRIYGREPSQTADGIHLRLTDGTMGREDDFLRDMTRWFDGSAFEAMKAEGLLADLWARTRTELEFGLALLLEPELQTSMASAP